VLNGPAKQQIYPNTQYADFVFTTSIGNSGVEQTAI